MRVFLCSYSGFSLAIPTNCVSSIFIVKDKVEKKIEYNKETGSTYISLPGVFNCPNDYSSHGIILKDSGNTENKIILLSTKIESEKDFPREIIFPIPKTLFSMQFSQIFSGIFFASSALGLLLNPEQLVQNILKESSHD